MSEANPTSIARIRRAGAVVELRLRLGRSAAVLPSALTTAFAFCAIVVVVRKVAPQHLTDRGAYELAGASLALALVVVLAVALRRLPRRAGTVILDDHHGLAGRLTNAVAFSEIPAAQRTPLMEAAIDDAAEHGGALRPGKAAPIKFPVDLAGSVLVAAGVVAVALFRVPPPVPVVPPVKTIDALTMSPDDIELFKDASQKLQHADQSPEMKAAIEKFNTLIEDIEKKRVERAEAFRRMEEIERELLNKQADDRKAFDEALKETAEELKKSDATKPLAESLEKKDFEKAKKDLKALADALKAKKKPDKAQLEKLAKALQKAAARKKEALANINERRASLKEELLAKKNKKRDADAGPPKKEEEKLLKKKERELERLDREAERKERAIRQLDKLDRDLAKAAQDLMKDLGMSAEDLEQAAEDIKHMQDEQMTDKEKEELKQRLEELRELLRQEGQGGKKRQRRLMKFGKRANGGKGQKGQPGQPGDEGDDDGDDGDGKDGKDGKDGQGKDGNGGKSGGKGGKGRGLRLSLGPGGAPIPGGAGAGSSPGAGAGESGGSGGEPGGHGVGTGHDGNLSGKATDLKGSTTDIQQAGVDSQKGPSNSKVIYGAAEKGFRGGGYKKVFTDYHTVAEQQINKDTVPDGYRAYVNRYFQLIRPRGDE